METEIREMLESYKKMYKELDDTGGPAENGELFEAIIGLEEDILRSVDLPLAQMYRKILWGDDIEGVIKQLDVAKDDYEKNGLHDPTLVLVNAIINKIDEPENVLPLAGLSLHTYQEFLFREKLLAANTPADADEIIAEMRSAEEHLNDLGKLEFGGIKKYPEQYTMLRTAGMHNLDEFLMLNDTFDLDDEDMTAKQFCLRGFIRTTKGKYEEAIIDFTHAIKVMPELANIYYNRAIVYEMMGDKAAAMDDYNDAIRLDPDDFKALCNRGVLRADWGWHEEALEDFNRAISLNPDAFQPYCNRGNLLALLEMHEDAIDDFSKAILMRPDEAYLYCNRGISYYQLGRKKKALQDIRKSSDMGFELAEEFMFKFFPEECIEQ